MTRTSRGSALPLVLWLVVAISVGGLSTLASARHAVDAAQHRVSAAKLGWLLEGCLARVRAAVDASLAPGPGATGPDDAWARLPALLATSPVLRATDCDVTVRPSGLRLDVNHADAARLATLLLAADVPDARADSLLAALLDWLDEDSIEREGGAEASTYLALGRVPPRNGPLRGQEEVALVLGFDRSPILADLLGADSEPVSLLHAPLPVLAGLPGMTIATAEALVRTREDGAGALLDRWIALLDAEAQARIGDRWPEFLRASVGGTSGWLVDVAPRTRQEPGLVLRARLERRPEGVTIASWQRVLR